MFSIRRVALFLISGFLVFGLAYIFQTPETYADAEGEAIFQQNCIACHTIGGGILVGPDLEGITERRDYEWLTRFILEPDQMFTEGDPLATQLLEDFNNIPMPNLGLSQVEVEAVLNYLSTNPVLDLRFKDAVTEYVKTSWGTWSKGESMGQCLIANAGSITKEAKEAVIEHGIEEAFDALSRDSLQSLSTAWDLCESEVQPTLTPSPTSTPVPTEPTEGDSPTGKALFIGITSLANGGTPCVACHTIGNVGVLGGGVLGPDLTQAYSKYGASGLESVLATLPFPTMKPIFENSPLTSDEQIHLAAFLQTSSTEESTSRTGLLVLFSIAGLAVLLILAQLFWRKRLPGVRKPLLKQGQKTGDGMP